MPASKASQPSAPKPTLVAPKASTPSASTTGRLLVNSTPWSQVYIDGQLVGNTPQRNLSINAGRHIVRIVHDGFLPIERQVEIAPGQELRLTDLVLSRP